MRLSKETFDQEKEEEDSALYNESILLEELIASCDGKSNPIHHYTAQELIRATNNFDTVNLVEDDIGYKAFRGFLENRYVIIKKMKFWDEAIRDIIISTQMSTHKNVLKLLGCCLEFPVQALVYEDAAKGGLNTTGGYGDNESLSLPWRTRLCIAKQVANALTYLHTAFPRPIIHRFLKPSCIYLDNDFTPKLCHFSYSVTIPPEQSHVEDRVIGTLWYGEPCYMITGFVTEKSDVYSFGVILLVLLTGRDAEEAWLGGEDISSYVKLHASDGQFQRIVDPKILEELGGKDEQAQQQQLCTDYEGETRPDMIDVAKELVRIEKSIIPC